MAGLYDFNLESLSGSTIYMVELSNTYQFFSKKEGGLEYSDSDRLETPPTIYYQLFSGISSDSFVGHFRTALTNYRIGNIN